MKKNIKILISVALVAFLSARIECSRRDATNELETIGLDQTQEELKLEQVITLLTSLMDSITNFSDNTLENSIPTGTSLAQMIANIIGTSIDGTIIYDLTQEKAEQMLLNYTRQPNKSDTPQNIYEDEDAKELLRHTFATVFGNAANILANPRNPQVLTASISNMVGSIINAIMTAARKNTRTRTIEQMEQMTADLAQDQDFLAEIRMMVVAKTTRCSH